MYEIRDVMQGVVCAVLVSVTYLLAKVLGGVLTPVELSVIRFVGATICFSPFIPYRELFRLKLNDLLLLFGAGMAGIFAYNVLMFMALEKTTSTNAALINAINPIMTMIAGALVFKHKIKPSQFAAFLLALFGVGCVVTRGSLDLSTLLAHEGDLYMLAASGVWAVYSMIISVLSHRFHGSFITFVASIAGLIPLFYFSGFGIFGKLMTLNTAQWSSVLYLGTLGTVGVFMTFLSAVKSLGPSMASFVLFSLLPLLVATLSYFCLGNPLSVWQGIGGLLILTALGITVRRKKAQ